MLNIPFPGKIHHAAFRKAAQAAVNVISEHEQKLLEICRLPAEEALRRYEVGDQGLTEAQVQAARALHGRNILNTRKQAGMLKELLQRCRNPLVIQLLIICVVSLLMNDVRSAVVVGVMVFLSVVLAYVQERRSSKAVEKLRQPGFHHHLAGFVPDGQLEKLGLSARRGPTSQPLADVEAAGDEERAFPEELPHSRAPAGLPAFRGGECIECITTCS